MRDDDIGPQSPHPRIGKEGEALGAALRRARSRRDEGGNAQPPADGGTTVKLYTLGHSTRSLEELLRLLQAHGIGVLADVRRFPRSPRNPQFNNEQLAHSLPGAGVSYTWLASLGGRRRSRAGSLANAGWRNPSFHAYADHMLTDEFERGLAELLGLARHARVAIMCAEALPWRCHRSLIADVLTARGFAVCHIQGLKRAELHRLTSFARVDGAQVTYPLPE
jgi:uncharacterized protein (DUF488 family)